MSSPCPKCLYEEPDEERATRLEQALADVRELFAVDVQEFTVDEILDVIDSELGCQACWALLRKAPKKRRAQ